MTITDVRRQVKRQHRFSIFIDGAYSFSLSETDVIDQRIAKGRELTTSELQEFQKLSQIGVSYDKLLRYISIRLRSRKEIQEYLHRKQVGVDDQALLIQKLERAKLLNDEAFAAAWIRQRRTMKHASSTRITYELRQKGINSDTIGRLLGESDIDERASLRALIAKKRRLSRYQDEQKLLRYLIGQGYRYGEVKVALKELDSAEE